MSRSSGKRKKLRKKKRKNSPRIISNLNASNADKHLLYLKSVQDAESAINFINDVFVHKKDKKPLSLREDFCGTALIAAAFVKSDIHRTAVGLDLDQETLNWGLKHNVTPLGNDSSRISLLKKDVLDGTPDIKFDVIAAFNFSYWVFKERKVLLDYFKSVLSSLNKDSVFLIDLHGGPDAQFQMKEPSIIDDFEYIWEQESFDPITHRTVCNIHFKFQDGSEIKNAFRYDWRYWTLPELKDILREAGFSHLDVWWDDDNGDDDYEICESAENMEAWVAYIAAWK